MEEIKISIALHAIFQCIEFLIIIIILALVAKDTMMINKIILFVNLVIIHAIHVIEILKMIVLVAVAFF